MGCVKKKKKKKDSVEPCETMQTPTISGDKNNQQSVFQLQSTYLTKQEVEESN